MSDAADDLEALFDEVAAQRASSMATQAVESTLEAVPGMASEPAAPPTADACGACRDDAGLETSEEQSGTMYERLGGIVRLLHDSLRELGYDRSLSDVAVQITDAQDRLAHIASLTEQAAVKVLNAVDHGMPEQDALAKKAKDMDSRWGQLFAGKLSVEEFKGLAGDSKQFAAYVMQASEAEKARLLEIMMAQDFQDITGQLIKKIIAITNTAERELAQLLRDNAPPEVKAAMEAAEHQKAAMGVAELKEPAELMQGPSTPGTAMAQDDVDSLLADLGF